MLAPPPMGPFCHHNSSSGMDGFLQERGQKKASVSSSSCAVKLTAPQNGKNCTQCEARITHSNRFGVTSDIRSICGYDFKGTIWRVAS